MPLLKDEPFKEELAMGDEERPSKVVEANAQINPWVEVARAWIRQPGPEPIRKAFLTVNDASNKIPTTMELMLPVDIPPVHKICLYWDAVTKLSVSIAESPCLSSNEEIQQAQHDTWTLLDAAFPHRNVSSRLPKERSDFIALFRSVSTNSLQVGSNPILCSNQISELGTELGLIRNKVESNQPYIFEEWLDRKPRVDDVAHPSRGYEELPEDVAYLAVSKLSHRANFLHNDTRETQLPLGKRFSCVLPQTNCKVDALPFRVTQFAMLLPSILHRLQVCLVGDMLSKTILADVQFSDPNLVVTAISASSAIGETNNQRISFLGDSLLKMCTSLQLLAEYPLLQEGELTKKREKVISNECLARAALRAGLDKFIITETFTGRKWRPIYVQDLSNDKVHMPSKRKMPTIVLAHAVEALFGAAKLHGGMSKAWACMRVFLPEINWQSLEDRRITVFERAPADMNLPPFLEPLQSLIDYKFSKKALLVEAMTHASYNSGTANLERLEFFGDAVLETVIVNTLYNQEVELSRTEMHHLRKAFVNEDFLAFMCMEPIKQETGKAVEDERTATGTVSLSLWDFMRFQALNTGLQRETSNRHLLGRDDINFALDSGSHYPWALLSRLQAPKFYSDVVESLLGAVYIDSGSIDACKRVMERMGILPYLRRVIRDNVHTQQPQELKTLAGVRQSRM